MIGKHYKLWGVTVTRSRTSLAIIGFSTSALLLLSACGGGDDSAGAAGAKFDLENACTVAVAPAGEISSAVTSYRYDQPLNDEIEGSDLDTDAMFDADDADQAELLSYSQELVTVKDELRDAVEADQGDTVEQLVDAAKGPFDGIIDLCTDRGFPPSESVTSLRAGLDEPLDGSDSSPAAPAPTAAPHEESEEPATPTAPGATLRYGQEAVIEVESDEGPVLFDFAVTEVAKADPADISDIRNLEDAEQVVYVRATLNVAQGFELADGRFDAQGTFDPQYELVASGGSSFNKVTIIGKFEPCDSSESNDGRQLCAIFASTSANAEIDEVSLIGFESQDRRDEPIFTWRK